MPDTTTDRFSETQAKILQRKIEASAHYPALWKKIIAEWNAPDPQDRVWLTYSANYIFRTNNIRWAIDPLTLDGRLKIPPRVDLARDLQNLSFVLLTHTHGDHLDLELISALRSLPITWVVPEYILPEVVGETGLPQEQIIVPSRLTSIELNGLNILPFDGLHLETTPEGTTRGVPAMGYLIESQGRRWLFPGDTRTYDSSQLPRFDPPDIIFAHLWLGRSCALEEPAQLLDSFCQFCLDTNPRRIVLTHLNELGRDANDYWDERHAQLVCSKFRNISPDTPVSHLLTGDSMLL
jgi:L-ascorbate metabolism protein UlaG (beta-lactamase superfamily)